LEDAAREAELVSSDLVGSAVVVETPRHRLACELARAIERGIATGDMNMATVAYEALGRLLPVCARRGVVVPMRRPGGAEQRDNPRIAGR
jgi:hypothetical protein